MHVVSFVSVKGGVGKSTLTANVASALRQRGWKVLAVDLDPQNNLRLHFAMDPADSAGLIREGMSRESIFLSPSGVYFLPFGHAVSQDVQAFAGFLQQHPDWLAAHLAALSDMGFDFVCIDTPPGASPYLQQALRASERAIVLVLADAASYATLPQMHELIRVYTEDRPQFRGARILLNQMPLRGQLGHTVRAAVLEDERARLVPVSIHRDPRIGQALAQQTTVVDAAPEATVAMDIEYFVDWLLEDTAV